MRLLFLLMLRFDDEIGRTRVFLRATRRIANGEEIFVPYDKNYWQDNFEEQVHSKPSVQANNPTIHQHPQTLNPKKP